MLPELPSFAKLYLPDFRRIRHAIELSEGFVLFPIQMSPDLAQALAVWLKHEGHPTVVIAPQDEGAGVRLVETLFNVKPSPGMVVMVIAASARSLNMTQVASAKPAP